MGITCAREAVDVSLYLPLPRRMWPSWNKPQPLASGHPGDQGILLPGASSARVAPVGFHSGLVGVARAEARLTPHDATLRTASSLELIANF